MELRNYQKDIVDKVFEKDDNVLIVLPTGGGKTVIAKELIKNIKEQVLFIVPKLDLIRQACDTFGEEVDIIWSDKTVIHHNHITVASKQTLSHRNLSTYFDRPIVVIVDEVHIGLQSLKKVLQGVSVKRIIGLTATPERNDGSSFIVPQCCSHVYNKKGIYDYAVFNRVIDDWNIQKLQELGYLSPLKVTLNPKAECLSDVKPKNKYDDELDSDVIMGALGDDFFLFVNKAKEFRGKPTLIFTPDLKSLDVVLKTVNQSGLVYKGIDGTMPVEERKIILNELETGKIDGVVNCGVLTTGFDMPKIKQCILIRNIKSKILLFQIIGRFIRPYNNETAEIYDFGGSCYNFATAANPNVFESPVQWKYEGFETVEKITKESQETDELKECLDEVNITWTEYLKDPVRTLLTSLLQYKEDFEINLCETTTNIKSELRNNFDNAVNNRVEFQVQKYRKEIKDEIIKNNEQIIQQEIEKRGENLLLNPLKSWFAENGFEWFRKNFARILISNNYTSMNTTLYNKWKYLGVFTDTCDVNEIIQDITEIEMVNNLKQKLAKIKEDTISQLPFDNLLSIISESEDAKETFDFLYRERTEWWLSNFKNTTNAKII